ncbi:kinase-like domain-containing protein [Xylaria bambusicola]|uniref:kinase-like domain-containing protein n=1 Tax=Xylaria bambusicola TaxID=326684 RepID=UPI0020081CB1|nr:kinase-like domain-containing protein [Xylaria bambusicola]KAI0522163.1 kinase-like domain-containing protein [Xylaria bambusicola]
MSESDKYEVLEKIGHGSFGIIRKVKRRVDGMVLCRKEISYLKMSQKEREQLHAEFQILSSLRHPNIVGYFHREHLKQTQDLHLYMEYCGNGDLGRVIRDLARADKYADEEFVWVVFSQLVTALYRCHYGIDPPDVGNTVLVAPRTKPKIPPGAVTILHRDLKPENVFLGENNSVKLGDFGLSKMIQSHDFASTYVGTPFYMSPEICAAERYTLKSDIWSLGCVIYELCAREPPFNAKSHFQLVQKIKEGKVATLPRIYSAELMAVIRDCLKVNPDSRPDTATLLNLPVVRLMRMQREAVDLKSKLQVKEAALAVKLKEAERQLASIESNKSLARQEIESSLRREWEVKARLEIDRLVKIELQELQRRFEGEVQARVHEELQKKSATTSSEEAVEPSSSLAKSEYPQSLTDASTDGEFPSTTDITEFSVDEPEEVPLKKGRGPFGRAQTMFERHLGTPMDIDTASPSPIAIASLSLSPRRANSTKTRTAHQPTIFDETDDEARWKKARDSDPVLSDSDDDDDTPIIPSPTRGPRQNPFLQRPVLTATKTAPVPEQLKAPIAFPSSGLNKPMPPLPSGASAPSLQVRPQPSNGALREKGNAPNRRLSKIPSAANLGAPAGENGLQRKPSLAKKDADAPSLTKVAVKNNVRGRTLVELQQARAGGRSVENVNSSPKRANKERVVDRFLEPAPVWDPERDEMPSPFLIRQRPLSRA